MDEAKTTTGDFERRSGNTTRYSELFSKIREAGACMTCFGTGTSHSGITDGHRCKCTYGREFQPLPGKLDDFARRLSTVTRIFPVMYREAGVTDFDAVIQQTIFDWYAGSRDLFIFGPAGTGKTHLGFAIYSHSLLHRGREVRFVRAAQFYVELRDLYKTNKTESSFLEQYTSPRNWQAKMLLVIDDVGSGNLKAFECEKLLEVLESRVSNYLRTVVTSNWSLEQISERMDDRIASRLASFQLLEMRGRDRRIATT